MADCINMQQTEYDEMQQKLTELHQAELESIRKVIKDIRGVCTYGGDFYVNQISTKVSAIMNCLESQVVSMLEKDFSGSEGDLALLINDLKEYDSV